MNQLRQILPDGLVERRQKAVRVLNLIDGCALVCDQSPAFDQELILLCLTAEDGMVFNHQAFHSWARAALEEQCGSESADSAANDYAVIDLPGIDDVLGKRIVHAVTNRVTGFENTQSVAILFAVVADSTATREVIT